MLPLYKYPCNYFLDVNSFLGISSFSMEAKLSTHFLEGGDFNCEKIQVGYLVDYYFHAADHEFKLNGYGKQFSNNVNLSGLPEFGA